MALDFHRLDNKEYLFGLDDKKKKNLDEIIAEYLNRKQNYATQNSLFKKADKEISTPTIYNANWVKFAFDGSHTSLYLDLAPSENGRYGQIIFVDDEYETGILVAHSTTELVENFKNDLENNLYYLAEDALEDGFHYLEADNKIDIVNWQLSEKWKR